MTRSKLFHYAILYHPPKKEGKDQEPSVILQPIKEAFEESDKVVGLKAAREIPDAYLDKIDDIEIVIRPF